MLHGDGLAQGLFGPLRNAGVGQYRIRMLLCQSTDGFGRLGLCQIGLGRIGQGPEQHAGGIVAGFQVAAGAYPPGTAVVLGNGVHAGVLGQGGGIQAGFAERGWCRTERLRRKLGHDAAGHTARRFQFIQLLAQPAGMTDRHPHRPGRLGRIRLERAVQLGHVIQHMLFQQAFEHRAQAGRIGRAALG